MVPTILLREILYARQGLFGVYKGDGFFSKDHDFQSFNAAEVFRVLRHEFAAAACKKAGCNKDICMLHCLACFRKFSSYFSCKGRCLSLNRENIRKSVQYCLKLLEFLIAKVLRCVYSKKDFVYDYFACAKVFISVKLGCKVPVP